MIEKGRIRGKFLACFENKVNKNFKQCASPVFVLGTIDHSNNSFIVVPKEFDNGLTFKFEVANHKQQILEQELVFSVDAEVFDYFLC